MVAPTHAGPSNALWRASCGAVVAVVCLSASHEQCSQAWGVVGMGGDGWGRKTIILRGQQLGVPQLGGSPSPIPWQTRDKCFRSGGTQFRVNTTSNAPVLDEGSVVTLCGRAKRGEVQCCSAMLLAAQYRTRRCGICFAQTVTFPPATFARNKARQAGQTPDETTLAVGVGPRVHSLSPGGGFTLKPQWA